MNQSTRSFLVLGGLLLLPLAVAFGPFLHLLSFVYHAGEQSYILLIPALTAGLIYRDADRVFADVRFGFTRANIVMFVAAAALIIAAYCFEAGSELQMVVTALAIIISWSASFATAFGSKAARAALFPLAMLLWIVPIPAVWVETMTVALQRASADMVDYIFRLTTVPVFRSGFIFELPGQSIEVAKECSGIRSSLSMIILMLIVAHESLLSNWRRAVLVLSTIPIGILKNGVRIVSLTLLAMYVDPSFLTGSLHHQGGVVFFLIGLLMLVPILALLRRGDRPPTPRVQQPPQTPSSTSEGTAAKDENEELVRD